MKTVKSLKLVTSPKAGASGLCSFAHGVTRFRRYSLPICTWATTRHRWTVGPRLRPHDHLPHLQPLRCCAAQSSGAVPADREKTPSKPLDSLNQPFHLFGLPGFGIAAASTTAVALLTATLAVRSITAGADPTTRHTPPGTPAAASRLEASAWSAQRRCQRVVAPRSLALASVSASPSSHSLQHPAAAFLEFVSYVNYKIMQVMTLPTLGKILTVMVVSFFVWVLGSWALWTCTGLQPKQAMLRCYLMLNNVPGADITSETDLRTALLLNLVYTVGLLTFAALIGLLGDDIKGAVEAARLGNFRVPERNHTVVLGHNRQLVEVLRQVALVRADRGAAAFPGQLVVLSERDRASLEETLLEALGPAAAAGVVTRQGSPLKVADLQRVSAGHARTVILLAPEPTHSAAADKQGGGGGGDAAAGDAIDGADADADTCLSLSLEARQSVTLAALHHLRRQAISGPGGGSLGDQPQTVVVQHDADVDLLDADMFVRGGIDDAAGGGGAAGGAGPAMVRHLVTPVSHLNSLSRIQAQCASQPGLSVVMSSIMQQQPGMPEFYVQQVPEAMGLTFDEARRLFPRAVLCGVYDPLAATAFAANSAEARLDAMAKAVVLNPPESLPILERYSLVLLADRTADLRISQARLHELNNTRKRTDTTDGDAALAAVAPTVAPAVQLPQQPQLDGDARSHFRGHFYQLFRRQSAGGGGGVGLEPGTRAERGAAPLRVVVLVFNGQQPEELLEGLADYCPPGSEAVVVASKDTAASRGPPSSLQQQRRLRVVTVASDPRTRGSLREAGAQEANAVILTGLEGVSTDQADAQALATLIQLQALMPPLLIRPAATAASSSGTDSSSGSSTSDWTLESEESRPRRDGGSQPHLAPAATRPPLNMVCGVTDPRVRDIMNSLVRVQPGGGGMVARRQLTIEAINSDELLAGVLTQVAAEPRLSGLFHELSTAEGVEIHLRTPAVLGLPYNQPLTWDQVQDAGRAREVTVIGLLRAAGVEAVQPRLLLGVPLRPSAGAATELRPGDKVVVLSGE